MVWGLLAALGWGGADVLGAVSGRRIGSMRTALIAQVVSLACIWAAMAVFRPEMNLGAPQIVMISISGVLAGLAYLCLYRALELGPVAIVSPIVAAFAAVTIVLALIFYDEQIGLVGGLGIIAALVGVILASTDLRAVRSAGFAHLQGGGIPWALGAMSCFGIGAFFLGRVAQDAGPLPATALARTLNVLTIVVIALAQLGTIRSMPRMSMASVSIAVAVGVTDIVGTFAFSYGTSVGTVSLVTAVSVALVAIPLIAGLVFFHERPAVSQYVGIAIVVVGLVALGSAA